MKREGGERRQREAVERGGGERWRREAAERGGGERRWREAAESGGGERQSLRPLKAPDKTDLVTEVFFRTKRYT